MDYETAELKAIRDGLSSGRYILIDVSSQTQEEEPRHFEKKYLNTYRLKRLLMNWQYYENTFNDLNASEINDAKALFFRLSYLPKDEKDFLAVVFRDNRDKHKTTMRIDYKWIASHFNLDSKEVAAEKTLNILHKMHEPREHPKGFKPLDKYIYTAVKIRGVAWNE